MIRMSISRFTSVLAIVATMVGIGVVNAQAATNEPMPQPTASTKDCTGYPFSTGDWVNIRATPGGLPILGQSMRFDHYSWPKWPNDYKDDAWMLTTNLRTGVRGWVSLQFVDWYQPTCIA